MLRTLSLKKQTVIYMFGNYYKIIMALVVNAILARILSANDYGVVAIISVFSVFFTTISDMGVSPAIVQIKKLSRLEINDIFSFTVYLALICSGLFAVFTYPLAIFYNDYIYIPVGCLLTISVFFNVVNMVPTGILNKDKRFVFIALRNIVVYSCSSIIAILLAIYGAGVYAIVFQSVLISAISFIANAVITKPSFTRKINWDSIKIIADFSRFQFAFNIVCYMSRNLDNLLTGKLMNPTELGYYNKAYSLMLYPVNNLAGVFSPILHPVMSEYQDNPSLIYDKYIRLAKVLLIIGSISSAICFMDSTELVHIILGGNWGKTAICFKWMSIAIVPQMLNSCVGAVYQSIGNTRLLFANSCINTIISVVAILMGVIFYKDIIILSKCIMAAYYFHFFAAHYMLIVYGFKYKFLRFVLDVKKEIIILIFIALGCMFWSPRYDNYFIEMLAKTVYVVLIWLAVLIISGEIKVLINVFRKNNE